MSLCITEILSLLFDRIYFIKLIFLGNECVICLSVLVNVMVLSVKDEMEKRTSVSKVMPGRSYYT